METNLLLPFLLSLTSLLFTQSNASPLQCSSLTAYYVGTFKNTLKPDLTYTLQFQVRLDKNEEDKRIYLKADQWNSSLADYHNFTMDFSYMGERYECLDIMQGCSGPFVTGDIDFTLDLNVNNSVHCKSIMYLKVFN